MLARLSPLIEPDAGMVAALARAGGILDIAVDPAQAARRLIWSFAQKILMRICTRDTVI